MAWLNENAAAVQAISTFVLVVITAAYVWFTRTMADQARKNQRPYVFLDIDARKGFDLQFMLGNAGDRAAKDISIELLSRSESRPWRNRRSRAGAGAKLGLEPLLQLPPFKTGVPYLAPGRSYRWDLLDLGQVPDLIDGAPGENVIRARLTYTGDGHRFSEDTEFDFAVLDGMRIQTFDDPLADIADEVRTLARASASQRSSLRDPFGFSTWCPFCRSPIQRDAAKCSACQEWLIPLRERIGRQFRIAIGAKRTNKFSASEGTGTGAE